MTLAFHDLPVASHREIQRRTRPTGISRRAFFGRTAAAATAASLAYLSFWDRAAFAGNDGKYYREWTNETTGPCAPGGYASNHTEEGRKCGPSYPNSGYCYTGSNTVSGQAQANTGNKRGWHKSGWFGGSGYYLQRPDECVNTSSGSDYDSWQWRYSDGWVYGCSDGKACSFYSCFKTICPYKRHQ